jgi:DNA-binding transcriptional LysR family regulator
MQGHLERRQLATLVAVGEELHFGRAAERLGLQQPALSQLIGRLEDQLGFLLFDRSSHHVRITSEGERMLVVARDVLAALQRAEELVGEIGAGAAGVLRLGATERVREQLSLMLERFHDGHPGVEVRVAAMETQAKLQGLLDGELDAALVRSTPSFPGIDILELWRERLVAVLSRRHPLADSAEVSLGELAAYPVILASAERNRWAREHAERLFAGVGATPVLGPAYSTLQEALAMIAGSNAWMIVHASVAEREGSASVVSRLLRDPAAEGPVSLGIAGVATGRAGQSRCAQKRRGRLSRPPVPELVGGDGRAGVRAAARYAAAASSPRSRSARSDSPRLAASSTVVSSGSSNTNVSR